MLCDSPWFDRAILALIVANSTAFAFIGPQKPVPLWLWRAALASQLMFSAEIIVRAHAHGLGRYLGSGWNVFDVVVVGLLWLPYVVPGVNNITAMRCVRALRPVRTISRLESIRRLCETMVRSIRGLGNVFILSVFILSMFAILGTQLFEGTLRFRCAPAAHGDDQGAHCRAWDEQAQCAANQECVDTGTNPGHGAVSFDSFPASLLTVFQCVTLEGWSDVMYMEMDALGPLAAVYFVALVVLGSFFLLNLCLAVVYEQFEPREERLTKKTSTDLRRTLVRHRSVVRIKVEERLSGKWFETTVMVVILLNTLALCCYYYGMSAELERALEVANLVFVAIFTVEVAVHWWIAGLATLLREPFNVFDITIVVVSIAEVAVEALDVHLNIHASSLRALRLLRVAKLARAHRGLRRVVLMMFYSVVDLSALLSLLILALAVFAMLGMELFGGRYTADVGFATVPRANFDDFGAAATTVFIVISGEDWNTVFMSCFAFAPITAVAFFGSVVIVGNFVIINLVITILISNIGRVGDEERANAAEAAHKPPVGFGTGGAMAVRDQAAPDDHGGDVLHTKASLAGAQTAAPFRLPTAPGLAPAPAPVSAPAPAPGAEPPTLELEGSASSHDPHAHLLLRTGTDKSLTSVDSSHEGGRQPAARAPLRSAALRVVQASAFEGTMLGLIALSAAVLAVEPLTDEARASMAPWALAGLAAVDGLITVAFAVELVVKVVAYGPWMYIRSNWNKLDALVVSASLAASASAGGSSSVKALRMARLLRPLRLISVHSGMQLVVQALLQTLPQVLTVCLVCVLFMAIFAILGVQLFGGAFGRCGDGSGRGAAECATDFANPHLGNFDSVPAAMLLLFELSSLECWPTVMFHAVDSVGPGLGAERGHNPGAVLYFVAWVLVGGLFMRNLFIGIIVDTFNTIKQQQDGLLFMTPEQQQWVRLQELLYLGGALQRAARPLGGYAQRLYDLSMHPGFGHAILALIFANTVCIAIESASNPPWLQSALAVANATFVAAFTAEALVKIIAFTPRKYLADPWHRFDLIVVLGSIVDLVMNAVASESSAALSPSALRALRLFRVARALRAVRSGRGIAVLLSTLGRSLPSLFNVALLLGLLLFVSGVVCMHLFYKVTAGDEIGRHASFATMPLSLLTLFRCATGESWNVILHDLMRGSGCAGGDDGWHGCATWLAVPVMLAYTLMSSFILINVLIAVILDNFAEARNRHGEGAVVAVVTEDHIEAFRDAWAVLDPDAAHRIHVADMGELVDTSPSPLGLQGSKSLTPLRDRMRLLRALRLPAYLPVDAADRNADAEAWVVYHDVLEAMITRAFGSAVRASELQQLSPRAQEAHDRRRLRRLRYLARPRSQAEGMSSLFTVVASLTSPLGQRGWTRMWESPAEGEGGGSANEAGDVDGFRSDSMARVFAAMHLQHFVRRRRAFRLGTLDGMEPPDVTHPTAALASAPAWEDRSGWAPL